MGQKKSKGGLLAAAALTPVVLKLVNKAVDVLADKVFDKLVEKVENDKSDKVLIPSLYDDEFCLSVDQAIEMLETLGLMAVPTEITFNNLHPKYRYCKENQVVGSNPKHKSYVPKGYPVTINYVTAEVIAESQKIFDESEKLRLEAKEDKRKKQEIRKEKMNNIVDRTKEGMNKLIKKK